MARVVMNAQAVTAEIIVVAAAVAEVLAEICAAAGAGEAAVIIFW